MDMMHTSPRSRRAWIGDGAAALKSPSSFLAFLVFLFLVALSSTLFLMSCATNPYRKYYVDETRGAGVSDGTDQRLYSRIPPQIRMYSDKMVEDERRAMEDDYKRIGYSSFVAPDASRGDLVDAAEKAGAELVLLQRRYVSTTTVYRPMTRITDTRTHYRVFSGNKPVFVQSTTQQATTYYVPRALKEYRYYATFWREGPPPRLGLVVEDTTDADKSRIQSNSGVEVFAVVKNSNAFKANLLAGDIIVSMDADKINSVDGFYSLVDKYEGRDAYLTVIRGDRVLEKMVRIDYRGDQLSPFEE
jgi:C-terminal processing protease CtpA/Prc